MDECPKCESYSLDYDPFIHKVVCTHCGWHKKMSEKKYYQTLADKSYYVCVPNNWKEKK